MAGARFEICHARGTDTAHRGYLWRLLSSNNIEVGRATVAFGDLESCRRRIRRVVQGNGSWVVIDGGHGRWTWKMRSGYTEVAASSRAYPRRAEAERAFHRFRHLATSPETTVVTRLPADRPPTVNAPAGSTRSRRGHPSNPADVVAAGVGSGR